MLGRRGKMAKREFNRGIKLYEALMALPNKARPKKLTHIPGDCEWVWDYTTVLSDVYRDADGKMDLDGFSINGSVLTPCGSRGCMLGLAAALSLIEDPEGSQAYSRLAKATGLNEVEVYDLAFGGA